MSMYISHFSTISFRNTNSILNQIKAKGLDEIDMSLWNEGISGGLSLMEDKDHGKTVVAQNNVLYKGERVLAELSLLPYIDDNKCLAIVCLFRPDNDVTPYGYVYDYG